MVSLRPLRFHSPRFLALVCVLMCPAVVAAASAGPANPATSLSSPSDLVAPGSPAPPDASAFTPRPVADLTEAQIALARRAFSCGPIDGIPGAQTEAALRAFQNHEGLRASGQLDASTRERLILLTPPLEQISLPAVALASFHPLSPTWLGKSQQTALAYESALEWAAERSHAHPALIRQLNPDLDWSNLLPGARLTVPAVDRVATPAPAVRLRIQLAAHVLEADDADGQVIAHFPVSIARRVEKRPAGELHVTVVIPDPDYTFDPSLFPESDEVRGLDGKLHLPPGPNNPVGLAWIGLDLSGYGIHGTPNPEKVGRTESHGCFRLANWDAQTLLDLAWVGLPVVVDP